MNHQVIKAEILRINRSNRVICLEDVSLKLHEGTHVKTVSDRYAKIIKSHGRILVEDFKHRRVTPLERTYIILLDLRYRLKAKYKGFPWEKTMIKCALKYKNVVRVRGLEDRYSLTFSNGVETYISHEDFLIIEAPIKWLSRLK